MVAGERLVAQDGYEVALFPLSYMYMSQDEGGDYSHAGTYSIDFLGWGANGRIYQCDYYAPCSMRCVDIFDPNANMRVWESINPVHLADGSLDYLTIYFAHDDNPPYTIGDTVTQGQVIGHTGTTGWVTGDHVHTGLGKGHYTGFSQQSTGNWDLNNRQHYWLGVYVNDTVIVEGYNHPWTTYQGPTPPVPPTPIPPVILPKTNFKFWLYGYYAKKKRGMYDES